MTLEHLTAVTIYISVLWDLKLCSLVETYKCFGATAPLLCKRLHVSTFLYPELEAAVLER
jgi:hypothetical protein